ncbi:MAG TPA: efflux RND transporter permease subunit [Oligoflexia bacterium]|nr:efflux RND transporter permease subunit [Oligoflexia bacterium]
MINALIKWCLSNLLLIFLAILGLSVAGYYSIKNTPVDAIPDIGEKQVIVYADWPGRSPQDVDDQVTYPLTTSLTGTPGVKAIRSMSGFGFSMVFLIFKDDVDYYWARSRVLERVNVAQQRLPTGVVPLLGPDATALGQIFWYTIEGEGFDLAELRSIQDWYLRYQLNAVEGVSEVASVGGFVRQYQIDLHSDKMRAHRVTLMDVYEAVRKSNIDVGAKVIEQSGIEYFIRGIGFIKSISDLENVVIRQTNGTPLFLRNVATIQLGPDFRRGALDKGGVEAVGGVVLMRYGENPRDVIKKLKEKIKQLETGLPKKTLADGRISQPKIVSFYDRTTIVEETITTLREALLEEAIVAGIVILIFMLHLRSTVTVLITLPLAVASTFLLMYLFGIDSNIMSLAGLAIAIGDVADMGIIMTENIYRRVAGKDNEPDKNFFQIVYEGASEVGGAIFVAVSNTIIAFIPVFFLTGQEGKLFKPLAFTKTFAIGSSVILALTVVPVMCYLLFRPWKGDIRKAKVLGLGLGVLSMMVVHLIFSEIYGLGHLSGWPTAFAVGVIVFLAVLRMTKERFLPLEENAVSRAINRIYVPSLRWVLYNKKIFFIAPVLLLITGGFIFKNMGREFMPPLDEGSFLYMPSLLPQASLSQTLEVIKKQDLAIASVPEVKSVVGKLGRAESALDPAPIGMIETIVTLKSEDEWRNIREERWYSGLPKFLHPVFSPIWPEERVITKDEILRDLQKRTEIPGVLPTWLQPIQTRLVMLQTGFRAMMGVKIFGAELKEIEKVGLQIEKVLKAIPGATDVIADRIVGKPYIEIHIDREKAARYGVNIRDAQDVIELAIGGMNLMDSVEGRERYPIRVRLTRDSRESIDAIAHILVPTSREVQIPLSQLATIEIVLGPQEIKGERGLLVGYVTMNTRDRDEVSVVKDAEKALQKALKNGEIKLPPGYYWEWSGQFENQVRATKRLQILVPLTLAIMFLMLYLGFKRWWIAPIIFFGVLVSASGGFIMLYLWGVNLSVAVWVGFLVLFGVVDDDGVVMSTYLEQIFAGKNFQSIEEIRSAVIEAGGRRIRPCLMTTATTVFGLMPIFLSTGRGSDIMQPMAIPSIGGMAVSIVTLFIVPSLFCAVEEWKWRKNAEKTGNMIK